VQQAFVRAYEHIGTFDGDRAFGPWFLKLVLRDAIKLSTRRLRHVELAPSTAAAAVSGAEDSPEACLERAETADEVWAALGVLPPAQRAAIVQRYYLDLTEAEMATAAGSNSSTIKWRLHAARKRLHSLLRPDISDFGSIS
jgi:RNA polymerase sigma-70 factor, ECF subfamily